MSIDSRLIDEIVAGVLQQLRAPVAAPNNPPSMQSVPADEHIVVLEHKVITEDLLEANASGAKRIRLAAGAIVTPTGRDWLRKRNVHWETLRGNQTTSSNGWRLLISTATPAIEKLGEHLTGEGWNRQLVGTCDEAADASVNALCRGEVAGIVVASHSPERVACRANRNNQVRGAAVHSVADVKRVQGDLNANLFAIAPAGKSDFELRTLLRTIARK